MVDDLAETIRQRGMNESVALISLTLDPVRYSKRAPILGVGRHRSRTRQSQEEGKPMDLHEYQARSLLSSHGVHVPPGMTVTRPEDARRAAARLLGEGADSVVVKAQVKTGGRGKAGGVRVARSADEAEEHARKILGLDIHRHRVDTLLIASRADVVEEFYFSILLDRSHRRHLVICSHEGGMDIEALAKDRPEAIVRIGVDADTGINERVARRLLACTGMTADHHRGLTQVLMSLWDVYRGEDATLVEVNPLGVTADGGVWALDAKVSLDDNARFRHPEHEVFIDAESQDPLEALAAQSGINYVRLNGQVGIIGNGAGLVMSTLDMVAMTGEETGISPANFLDIGGGADAETMAKSLGIVLGDERVRSVLVNVFGGITACDRVAEGILTALGKLSDTATTPIVVRLNGNRVDEGRTILAAAQHPFIHMADTMDAAACKAVELARLSHADQGGDRQSTGEED